MAKEECFGIKKPFAQGKRRFLFDGVFNIAFGFAFDDFSDAGAYGGDVFVEDIFHPGAAECIVAEGDLNVHIGELMVLIFEMLNDIAGKYDKDFGSIAHLFAVAIVIVDFSFEFVEQIVFFDSK